MSNQTSTTTQYRTFKHCIKKGHSLYRYAEERSRAATALYNRANFLIRQIYTGLDKSANQRHPNQQNAINLVEKFVHKANLQREKSGKGKQLTPPDANHKFVTKDVIDVVIRNSKDKAISGLSAQMVQQVIMDLYEAWDSFFKSLDEYKLHPEKFTGRPNIPKYRKPKTLSTLTITNQDAYIDKNAAGFYYLKLPKPVTQYWLGNGAWIPESSKFVEVKLVPKNDCIVLETVFEVEALTVDGGARKRCVGIDLGVENFATLVTNLGLSPILIKGGDLKATNQYHNKKNAELSSMLPKNCYSSRSIRSLFDKRSNQIDDYMHKVSKWIVDWCLENNIDCIVVGKTPQWKTNVELGDKNNQNFCFIPHATFIEKLAYKADAVGIEVIAREESYTSQASFLDYDAIPAYKRGDETKHVFSGKRVHRGLYRSGDGTLINADVNAAANILVKVIPTAFDVFEFRGASGVVDTPVVVRIGGSGKHDISIVNSCVKQSRAQHLSVA